MRTLFTGLYTQILIYLTSSWSRKNMWHRSFQARWDRSICNKTLRDTYFTPKFASALAPFWNVLGELCRCQPRASFGAPYFPRLSLIPLPRGCVEQSCYSLGVKDKVSLAPMSGSFGDELIVVGSPDHKNGNSKKSINRRGCALGGVSPATGIQ